MYVTIGFNIPSQVDPNEPETVVYYNANRVTPQPLIDASHAPSMILDSTLLSNAGVIFLPSKTPPAEPLETSSPPASTAGDDAITTTPRQISSVSYWDSRVDLGSYSIVPQYIEPMGTAKPSKISTNYDLSAAVYSVVYAIDAVMLISASLPQPTKNACTLTQN